MHFNGKPRNFLLLFGLFLVSMTMPAVTAGAIATGHPFLLFHDISETPGYQYRTTDPWKGWETSVISAADGSLSRKFSSDLGSYDRISYRGGFARDLGLAYQITKKSQYAVKAKEALLNLGVGSITAKVDKANALAAYSLAYDFIQPTLDPATDEIIRDKLATLADMVYKDLNDNGSTRSVVSFADYHGQAYPDVGIAGAALFDYSNPNHLPLASTPEDWKKVGTSYLFVNDVLHSYNRSLFSFGFDEASGKHLNGAYKNYVLSDFEWWLQVYNHVYQKNPFDVYPAAKKAFSSELWDSLPNGYSSNYVTLGNTKWLYHASFMNLFDDQTKSMLLNFDENLKKSQILPYSRVMASEGSAGLLYCISDTYANLPRTLPDSASHLDKNSIFQVFRENGNQDSDWLSLVTLNINTESNRDMNHHDQLSIEYYSRGDLLLADGGENKKVIDKLYGDKDIDHNTITIEDPRTPFPVSPWSGSSSQGIYKGNTVKLHTPVSISSMVQTPWMELMETHASITKVVNGISSQYLRSLSSPIQYERTILYPESDYFVIIDRMEGTEPWVYRNIFRPTSLMVTPTVDANNNGVYTASEVGHVNGALTIGTNSYNWQALPYKTETKTGITTNSLTWTTKNPYGKDVQLNLFSSPSSEILIEKNVGRIGGYDAPSEVFSPLIWFRTPQSSSEYRVTALLSSYTNEGAKTANEIPVTGIGHAMKVHSPVSDDYIYTGKGISSFATFTTDADTVFIRKTGQTSEFTLLNGSYLKDGSANLVTLSKKVTYFTLKQEGKSIKFKINGLSSADIKLENIHPLTIKRDGTTYTSWVMQNNSTVLKISTDLNEHEFEISTTGISSINSIGTPSASFVSNVTSGKSPLSIKFTDTSTGSPSSWNWSFGDGKYSKEKNPVHTYTSSVEQDYTVELTVANSSGSDRVIKTKYINVSSTTITTPTITVTSPNGGETLKRGTTNTVSWSYTGSPGSTVNLVLLKGSTAVGTIADSVPTGSGGKGSYSWPLSLSGSGGPAVITGSAYRASAS